jgi:hypothetical protein
MNNYLRPIFLNLCLIIIFAVKTEATAFCKPLDYEGDTLKSSLPLIKIDTYGQDIPDEPKVAVGMGIIDHGIGQINTPLDSFNDYHGMAGIELRGSSSQMFEKKPYGFETWKAFDDDTSVSLLGLPAESDWILYPPYSDKSLIRNALAYYLFGRFGHYSPRTRFLELLIDDNYNGLYALVEKIKRDKNRVNIAKLTKKDTSGIDLTGGYILKIDKKTGSSGTDGFSSHYWPYVGSAPPFFIYEYPDGQDILPAQQIYIENKVTAFEKALYGEDFKDSVNGYRAYIDISSFVDYLIMNEFSKNVDAYCLSTFIYKDRDDRNGKFHAGPIWDCDLTFGNADYADADKIYGWQYLIDGGDMPVPFWWERLLMDPYFTGILRCRWEELRQGILQNDSINTVIDDMVNYIGEAATRNFIRFPILGIYVWPNSYVGNTYAEEIAYLKNWISQRLNWLDENLPGICIITGNENSHEIHTFHVDIFPNPSRDFVHLDIQNPVRKVLRLTIYDITGQQVVAKNLGSAVYIKEMLSLPPGMYQIRVNDSKEYITLKAIVK